jgi:hypothetical protein
MVEFDCEPLSGRGKPIHAIIEEGGYCAVDWGDAHFEFPYALIDGILANVFIDENWHPLGSYRNNPSGVGLYIREQEICSLHSPQFASAIAPIMVELGLLISRPSTTIINGIELKRVID